MLHILDILLSILHLGIIGFNLFGWIGRRTRRAHLALVALTAGSWLVLGIWYGLGYCPVTDWQWQVKRELGVRDLPPSYITWLVEKLSGRRFPGSLINTATAISFAAAAALSITLNLRDRLRARHPADDSGSRLKTGAGSGRS